METAVAVEIDVKFILSRGAKSKGGMNTKVKTGSGVWGSKRLKIRYDALLL